MRSGPERGERDDPRRQIGRYHPAVGQCREPTVEPTDVVEHREQRAGTDGAGRTEQMRCDVCVPFEMQLFDFAHRDAHVATDLTSAVGVVEAVHSRPRVATACTTVIWRFSAPASTSSTCADP